MDDPIPRPTPFDAGMRIGLHLTIERTLSAGPGRAYYLANNRRPRWYTHICWNCGHKHNPPKAQACEYCQHPLVKRRFVLACRWEPDQVEVFHKFAAMRVKHYAICSPMVLYQYREQLLAFYEVDEEALLIDEPAPLHPRTLLAAAWTLAAGALHLLEHGVVLADIRPEHVLVGREGSRLWDVDIEEIRSRPVHRLDPANHAMTRALGRLMRSFTPVDQTSIAGFFQEAAIGSFTDLGMFQRQLRRFAQGLELRGSTRSAAALTSVGRRRSGNEDAWGWQRFADADVFVLADGMGGYHAGDLASATAVQSVLRSARIELAAAPKTAQDRKQLGTELVETANLAVRELANDQKRRVGTTLVVFVLWKDGKGLLCNVGDSRAYRVRKDKLEPLTDDHSMVGAMVEAGKLDREGARVHPRSNVLLRYLGNSAGAEADVTLVELDRGDRILLCSDGLWGEMPESELQAHLDGRIDPRRQLRVLIAAANERGGKDNVTAVLVGR